MLYVCFIRKNLEGYVNVWGEVSNGQKRENFKGRFEFFFVHCLHPVLCSAPTLWRQQANHPASVFLIPSDVGKLFAP